MRRRLSRIILFVALIAGVAFAYGWNLRQTQPAPLEATRNSTNSFLNTQETTHVSTILSRAFFDEAYQKATQLPALPEHVRGGIVPHHLLAAPLTAAFVEAIAPQGFTRVIIIGPDHLNRARTPAVVAVGNWKTPYGNIEVDQKVLTDLLRSGVVSHEEELFDVEHSVAALTPFLRRSFPKATIVPILVNERLSLKQAEELAVNLPHDAGTLTLASVDFSHEQPTRVALFHDQTSRAVLTAALPDAVGELEVDSPATLRVFLRAMIMRGAGRLSVSANTTGAVLSQNPDAPATTSYVIAAAGDGTPAPEDTLTVLAVGDMMFDRKVRRAMEEKGSEYQFAKIRGVEDRFFRGVDVVVGNLEGAIGARRLPEKSIDFAFALSVAPMLRRIGFDAVNLANNHSLDQGRAGMAETVAKLRAAGVGSFGDQVKDDGDPWVTEVRGKRIAMLGFNITDNPLDFRSAEESVRRAAAAHDFLLVQVHWGAEYTFSPTEDQRALGRRLTDWGADAVIGHHPHVMQGMEVWKGRPIFWSLGNFIFDQYFSEETQRGLAIGLAFSGKRVIVYIFPIISEQSQPRLAIGDEDRKLLATFAERSQLSDSLRSQALRGIVELEVE